jgi:transposase
VVYVGLDVHRRRTQVAAVDAEGHELFNRNVPDDVEKPGDVLVGFEPGTPVVFEATYGWAWLAELLHEMGFGSHLAHPAACKAIDTNLVTGPAEVVGRAKSRRRSRRWRE